MFSQNGSNYLCFIRHDHVRNLRFHPKVVYNEDTLFLLSMIPLLTGVVQSDYKGYYYRSVSGSLSRKKRPVLNSVVFLKSLLDIWQAQREWLMKLGVAEFVRECLRAMADGDIRGWAMFPGVGDPREIRRAYFELEREGALSSRHVPRYVVPYFILRWTGCFIGYRVLARCTKVYRRFVSAIRARGKCRG